jgi:hypothetical protein
MEKDDFEVDTDPAIETGDCKNTAPDRDGNQASSPSRITRRVQE